jgi:exosome complex protein LRP1
LYTKFFLQFGIDSVTEFIAFLRLNGVNAKEHPVFRELTRLKQYFEKIKIAEAGESKRDNLSLNKAAAGRIIKHALVRHTQFLTFHL